MFDFCHSNTLQLLLVVASFPLVLGDFDCDVTCQSCRARFQYSSAYSDSANCPGDQVAIGSIHRFFPSQPPVSVTEKKIIRMCYQALNSPSHLIARKHKPTFHRMMNNIFYLKFIQ